MLATNQLQFVPMCDVVVVMKGGQLAEVGNYQDLMAKGGALAALMKETTVSKLIRLLWAAGFRAIFIVGNFQTAL